MSETNSSSSPNSDAESVDRAESSLSELDPDLDELCRAQNRNVAVLAALRILIPLVLVSVLVTIGAWTYVQFATTRNRIREQLKDDPGHAMDLLIRASGKEGNSKSIFPSGIELDPAEFDSRSFRVPSLEDQGKRR